MLSKLHMCAIMGSRSSIQITLDADELRSLLPLNLRRHNLSSPCGLAESARHGMQSGLSKSHISLGVYAAESGHNDCAVLD